MNNANTTLKVLFIGESWHIHMIHSKGYDSFTSSKYEEGATWLLACLKKRRSFCRLYARTYGTNRFSRKRGRFKSL